MAIIQNLGFDNVIEFERRRRQPRRIRATNKDLHGMVADFLANLANLSLCHNVAAAHQHDAVGDAIDFLQNMTGNYDVHSLLGNRFEKPYRFRTGHGIKAVERFVKNQHGRMMRNGLSQANALPHPLAVARHFTPRHLRHAGPLQSFVREFRCLAVAKPMETQRPIDEVVAIRAGREGVKLRAVSHLPEELDGLLRGEAEDTNCALRRPDQASQQVHQRGLARAVGAHKTGNPGLEGEAHFVHAENFSVKLGDALENDLARVRSHPRTVSRERKRALRMTSASMQTHIREPHAAATGISFQPIEPSTLDCSRNPLARIMLNKYEKFSSRTQIVPMMALNISPRPAGTKNVMKITPVATIRNFTQADTASESSESMRIHIAEHNTIGTTIHKCDQIHPFLARPACKLNKSKPGTQVTPDSNKPSTVNFPRT